MQLRKEKLNIDKQEIRHSVIEEEAFLNYLDDTIKYLSFEDTITACKKCAFNIDKNSLELCPKCKVNYKGIQYSSCIHCLPPDKRELALKKVKFGSEFHAIHKELGID